MKKKVIIIVGSADGNVSHWHVNSGKINIHIQYKKKKNAINCNDYSFDYKAFIMAGNDITVRVKRRRYENRNSTNETILFDQPGYSGRIFCVNIFQIIHLQ